MELDMEQQRYKITSASRYVPPEWYGRPAAMEDEDLSLVDPDSDAPLTDICVICHRNMRCCILSLKLVDTGAEVEQQIAEDIRNVRKTLEEDYLRLGLWMSDSGVFKGRDYLMLSPNLEKPLRAAFAIIHSELSIMKAEIDGWNESELISDTPLSVDVAGQRITSNIHFLANMQSLIHNAQAIQLKKGPKAHLQALIDDVFENYAKSVKNLNPEDSAVDEDATYLTIDDSSRNSINDQCEYCHNWFKFGTLGLHQELRHGRKETDLMTSSIPSPEAITRPISGKSIIQKLDSDDEIRLLKVLRGKRDEPICCILYTVALSSVEKAYSTSALEAYDYDALSYCWGNDLERHKVTLFSFVKDHKGSLNKLKNLKRATVYVRSNLEAALRQIRSEDFDRNIWVDAICINRADKKEMHAQIENIPAIFSKAKKVIIWLGVEDARTEKTFDVLEDLLDLKKLEKLLVSTESPEKWKLVLRLLENRWFSRRWVVQEVVFARVAILYCGSKSIRWSKFAAALALLVHEKEKIYKILDRITNYDLLYPLGAALTQRAEMISNAACCISTRSMDGKVQQNLLSLEYLVTSLLVAFEVSDPRDTIYALLSIAKETSTSRLFSISKRTSIQSLLDSRIAPDYHKDLLDVYTDFMDYCIETSNSLDIICRHWAPVSEKGRMSSEILAPREDWEEMPSWIQSVQGHALGSLSGWRKGRMNGDSFVDSMGIPHQKTYSASTTLQPRVSFGKLKEFENSPIKMESYSTTKPPRGMNILPQYSQPQSRKFNGTLYVKGRRLCEITEVTGRTSQGMIQQEAFRMGGWPLNSDPENVPDQLWRTIVANRGPRGTPAPSWYWRACVECLKYVDGNGDLNTNALKVLKGTPNMLVEFLERVQQVVWNRRFFQATSRIGEDLSSLFGLVPANAKVKDIICIIFGCSVPVVLRERTAAESSHFELVGECYVYGYMDGEAIDSGNRDVYPYEGAEMFNLR